MLRNDILFAVTRRLDSLDHRFIACARNAESTRPQRMQLIEHQARECWHASFHDTERYRSKLIDIIATAIAALEQEHE